jgi:hypothetical protein
MDMVRYRRSGNPRLTGEQLLAPPPEIEEIASVDVDKGNPWDIATDDDLRKIAVRMNEVLRSPGSTARCSSRAPTRSRKPPVS